MTDYRDIERLFTEQLQLERRPVAIALLDEARDDVPRFNGTVPSACTFWRLASEGRVFSAAANDHHNCPIGAYTHNIDLPSERAGELTDTLGLMANIGYIRMEEVPSIPRLSKSPAAVVYAPLGETPVDPDVVLFMGRPGILMRLQEAAARAGIAAQMNTLGRPTCMAVPATLQSGLTASTGCIGNRVYTDLDDSELYVAAPGSAIVPLSREVQTIATANATLLEYHTNRRRELLAV